MNIQLRRESNNILSLKPFASIIFTAWSMIFDMSICEAKRR
jgi:hypothetical protein